jgi:hypothetical protein
MASSYQLFAAGGGVPIAARMTSMAASTVISSGRPMCKGVWCPGNLYILSVLYNLKGRISDSTLFLCFKESDAG